MNKQRIRYLTAGLVAVALLAACGSDDDSGTESSSTEAATDGTEAETAGTEAETCLLYTSDAADEYHRV